MLILHDHMQLGQAFDQVILYEYTILLRGMYFTALNLGPSLRGNDNVVIASPAHTPGMENVAEETQQ